MQAQQPAAAAAAAPLVHPVAAAGPNPVRFAALTVPQMQALAPADANTINHTPNVVAAVQGPGGALRYGPVFNQAAFLVPLLIRDAYHYGRIVEAGQLPRVVRTRQRNRLYFLLNAHAGQVRRHLLLRLNTCQTSCAASYIPPPPHRRTNTDMQLLPCTQNYRVPHFQGVEAAIRAMWRPEAGWVEWDANA